MPKSDAFPTSLTSSALPGQHKKTVVKKIVKKTTKDGEVKVEETVLSNPDLAALSHDQVGSSHDDLVRKESASIVNTAVEEAKKSLSQESLQEKKE